MPTLISAFPDFLLGNGIFSEMGTVPWGSSPSLSELDTMFFSDYGSRNYSPLVMILLSSTATEILSDAQRLLLATLIKNKYSINWSKQYIAITSTYSADKNIDITESENTSEDVTAARTGTVVDASAQTSTVANKIFGFDSSVGVDSSSGSGTNGGTNTQTNDLTDTTGREFTKGKTSSGINGATSKQELLIKELELRKWNFFDSVLSDVSNMLSIPIFNSLI